MPIGKNGMGGRPFGFIVWLEAWRVSWNMPPCILWIRYERTFKFVPPVCIAKSTAVQQQPQHEP